MIKEYKVEYGFWDCIIEINTELFTEKLVQEALSFFCWSYNEQGDLYEEYAKKLGKEILLLSIKWNRFGIIDEFKEKEGFPSLDGSIGVKLIRCDTYEFNDDEFRCKLRS